MTPTRRVSAWRERMLRDVGSVRRGMLYCAIAALAGSLAVSWFAHPYRTRETFVLPAWVVVASLLAWQLRPWRPQLFALAAAVVAAFVPEATTLWVAVAGLLYICVYEDDDRVPWAALVGGLGGAATSVWFYDRFTWAPFYAVVLGVGLGLVGNAVARMEGETVRLRAEQRRSREQASWLEQRTSLARELHDVVGHHVTAMVVQAEAGLVGDRDTALEMIGTLGRQALGELDTLVVHLRDPDAALTVTAPPRLSDIDELLAAPLRQHGVDVVVRVDPEPGLDDAGVLTAYRITQEALTNVARHAEARSAWVELVAEPGRVRLRVADDGVGPPASPSRGQGLVGIAERVSAQGGLWSMSERPGGGTVVDVYLPVRAS